MELTIDIDQTIKKARQVLTNPKKFFEGIAKEKSLKPALSYYLVLSVASSLLSLTSLYTIYPFIENTFPGLFTGTTQGADFYSNLIFILLSLIFNILGAFFTAGLLFIWLKVFKVKGNYSKVFILYAYARTPSLLLGWAPVVSAVGSLWTLYLLIIGTSSFYGTTTKKSFLIYVVPVILLLLATFLAGSLVITNAS